MGWDCTYHLVDPAGVGEALAALLKKGGRAPAGFADAYGSKHWAQCRSALLEGDLDAAARRACILAIEVSALLLPHAAQRGIALSLGLASRDEDQPPLAARMRGSPEKLLAALVRARPKLKGRFPGCFESSGEAGVLLEPARVPAVAVMVRQRMLARRQESLRAMAWTLGAAAARGLAWWEATDLAVPQSHPELLGPEPAIPAPDPADVPVRELTVGEVVFHLRHGPLRVCRVEAKVLAGEPRRFYVVETLPPGAPKRMLVPAGRQFMAELRAAPGAAEADAILDRLANPTTADHRGWSRRHRRHQEALRAGKPVAVADLVAQLTQQGRARQLSLGERSMLAAGRALLAKELAAALGTDLESAERRMDERLEPK